MRTAYAAIATSRRLTRRHQARDVDARHQHNRPDRGQQPPQRGAPVADDLQIKGLDDRRDGEGERGEGLRCQPSARGAACSAEIFGARRGIAG